MAVKRGKPEPILNEVILCTQMGWTLNQLKKQPARFIELLQAYLAALSDCQNRERLRAEEDLESKLRKLRL